MRWIFHCGRRKTSGPSLALGVELLVHPHWGIVAEGRLVAVGPSPQISLTFLRWFCYCGVMFPVDDPPAEGPVAMAAPREPIGPAPLSRAAAVKGDY